MERLSPFVWALAVAQITVGILEGTFAIMALGISLGAAQALHDSSGGAHLREPLASGRHRLVAVLFGLAALLVMLCAALALVSGHALSGYRYSLWLAGGSVVLLGGWRRSHAGSLAIQALCALGAVCGSAFGWAWADPLGGLLLSNIPLRTAWSAAVDAFGGCAAPDGAGTNSRRHKSA